MCKLVLGMLGMVLSRMSLVVLRCLRRPRKSGRYTIAVHADGPKIRFRWDPRIGLTLHPGRIERETKHRPTTNSLMLRHAGRLCSLKMLLDVV